MKYLDRLRESFHTSFECLNPTLSTLRVLGFTQLAIHIHLHIDHLFFSRYFRQSINHPQICQDAAPAAAPAKTPKKKVVKPKKPAVHPKYSEMIKQAVSALKERGGSSRQAVLKYIVKNFNVGKDEKVVNSHLKMALRAGVKNGSLKQAKGTGAAGSFRLGDAAKKADKPKKKPAAKKPAAKKPNAKKAVKKPKADKKTAKPKKAAAKKPAKSPKKAAKKPAAKKPAAKKPAAKKTAKKPAAKKTAAKK